MPTSNTETWENFKRWWSDQQIEHDVSLLEKTFTAHPIFTQAMLMNRSITTVVDLQQMKYLFWSGNVKEVLGWENEDYLTGGVQFAYSKIHPDDLESSQSFSQQIVTYYKSLPENEKNLYKSYWDVRMRKSTGNYVRVLLQDCALKNDANGNMVLLLSLITDVTSMKHDRSNHLRMTNGKENQLREYNNVEKKVYALDSPTERELNVFQLISQGYQRKQIADNLSISLATVKTHCQHVFEKLRTNDSVETINLLKVLGLL